MPIQPESVSPGELASARVRRGERRVVTISGTESLGRFGRIPEPFRPRGSVTVEFEFGRDEGRGFRLGGALRFEVEATCQRCLDSFTCRGEADADQGVLERAADAPVGETVDDYVVLDGKPLDVLRFVEDELILALPLVPSHPAGACRAADAGADVDDDNEPDADDAPNPFAVLAALKDKPPEDG